jgi:transcription elongation factor GreB
LKRCRLAARGILDNVNKAFTKEDEANEPELGPARTPLPSGTPNYVTARGLALLRAELAMLDDERARASQLEAEKDRARAIAQIAARKTALEERIATASLVDVANQPHGEVRFGATVEVQAETGASRTYKIVGVDEADPATGLIAFISPIARALLGRSEGESVSVRTPRGEEELEIVRIEYDRA